MQTKPILLTFTVLAAFTAASCARKEPPVVVEQQQQPPTAPAPVAAAQPPAPEPVRESAWKPAPVRSAPQKPTRPAGATPLQPAQPAQPAQPSVENDTPAPAPAPAPVPVPPAVVAESKPAPAVPPTPPPPPQPMKVTLTEGSILAVRLGETLSSEKNETGDTWSGVLAEPLVINGFVIAERGSRVEGRVLDVKRAGRVKGVANLTVELTRFSTADGQRIRVQTSGFSRAGKDETKRDVGKVAIASGIGAAIGAIAGGGKGAGIGAGAGAAAGTGAVLVTRGGPAVLSNETLIRFRVAEPVTITEKLR